MFKVYERITFKQIRHFMENIFFPNFNVVLGKATQHAAMSYCFNSKSATDKGKSTEALLKDLSCLWFQFSCIDVCLQLYV